MIKPLVRNGKHLTAKERLFLNSTRDKVVPANSLDAAFLLCPAGCELDAAVAKKFGLPIEGDEVKAPLEIDTRSTRIPKSLATR